MTLPLAGSALQPALPVRVPALSFVVWGEPVPQGSKTPRIVWPRVGKPFATMHESNPATRPWRRKVAKAGAGRVANLPGWEPLDGPLAAQLEFTMAKPPSYPKLRRSWPAVPPDVDKLIRAIFDGLKVGGVVQDDARIIELRHVMKHFPGEHPLALPEPGVRITLWSLT